MSLIIPKLTKPFKYIKPSGLYATTLANVAVAIVNDATIDELVFETTASGAGSLILELLFQIPDDFKKFAGKSDDLSLVAVQDAGADNDSTITIDVIDASGADADDDSVNATDLTNAFATYDCAITGGTFAVGDYITIKITVTNPDADDDCRISIPKLKYLPQ
ncbi:hypothetical protein LCGC14_0987830 [marine sediment metagenome]|uniref:Uncharacterized protein n=1 Tax=marine sediment metagenome TaxID=412755 RepID=A0A0F9NBD8_9ZZZZ